MGRFVYEFLMNSQLNIIMASTNPKMRSITGKLVANVLTEREDDFTYNVTYVASRTIKRYL